MKPASKIRHAKPKAWVTGTLKSVVESLIAVGATEQQVSWAAQEVFSSLQAAEVLTYPELPLTYPEIPTT
jgi:hypothetical protein